MREIKFRAWNGKQMIEPYSVRNGKAFVIRECDKNDPVIRGEDGANYYKNWDIDVSTDFPVMQFTGLRDKNGVEIYESDIVDHDGIGAGLVVFDESCAAFKIKFNGTTRKWFVDMLDREYDLLSVIGNIHENRELLK